MPNALRSGSSATSSMIVEQFGLASRRGGGSVCSASGLTSGITSGTAASPRNADELSTTRAPAAFARCASGTAAAASTPRNTTSPRLNANASAATSGNSRSAQRTVRPAEFADATAATGPRAWPRAASTASSSSPTAPVAPTTAMRGSGMLVSGGRERGARSRGAAQAAAPQVVEVGQHRERGRQPPGAAAAHTLLGAVAPLDAGGVPFVGQVVQRLVRRHACDGDARARRGSAQVEFRDLPPAAVVRRGGGAATLRAGVSERRPVDRDLLDGTPGGVREHQQLVGGIAAI